MPTGAEISAVTLPEKRGREAAPYQLNLEEPPSWGSRSVDCFEKIEQIGEGTYGQVYQAKEKETDEIVALKKVRMDNEREGFPITAIREIKILKKLRHENVILLKEIVTSKASDSNKYKGSIYMVFEYMEHDLSGLSDRPGVVFSPGQIKCYMKQLLMGLHYCHINSVLHRDIKGSNLLINNDGRLKLADFGLARSHSDSDGTLTNRVITLWYRPPELLLGAVQYDQPVDMWSVGCIFAELLNKKPILPGKNEVEQLHLIFQLCGSPTEDNWPGFGRLPWANKVPERQFKRRIHEVFRNFDPQALDLVEKLLTLDPAKRVLAKEALDHDYFWSEPFAMELGSMPKYESSHEFQTKKRRQEERQRQENARRHGGTGAHPQQQRQQHGGRQGPQGQQAGGAGMHPPHRQGQAGGHNPQGHGHQPGTSSQPYHGPGGRHAPGGAAGGGSGAHGGHPSGSGRQAHQAGGAAAAGAGGQYSGRPPPLFGGQAAGYPPPPTGMGRGAPYAQPYAMPVPYGVYVPPMPPPPPHGVNPYGMPQYNDIDGTYARGAVNPYQGRPLSPPHRQYDRQNRQ